MTSVLLLVILGLVILIFTQRYIEKNSQWSDKEYYVHLKTKVLNNDDGLPIIWIYVPHHYNARHWLSFGSRSSYDTNEPYMNLSIKSIIKHCDKSFKICIIDDDSFSKLIPNWNINLSSVGEPMADYIRQMAQFKLVYYYGGMIVPPSFLCLKNLTSLFKIGTANNNMFVVENNDRNITSVEYNYYPDINFMGASQQKCRELGALIEFIERRISADYTSQFEFLGEVNRWCNKRVQLNKINLIPGNLIGIKTIDNSPILIEDLLGSNEIRFDNNMYGIYIPNHMLLQRTNYQWFIRSSQVQILEGNFILARYFIESLGNINIETFQSKPDWVSYWRVPLRAPVWGLKPKYLGNNVPKQRYP